jgi:hypothetical protein
MYEEMINLYDKKVIDDVDDDDELNDLHHQTLMNLK